MAESGTITDLLLQLRTLPRADKLRVMQFLVSELAKDEGLLLFEQEGDYPLWTPYNAFDAAQTLLDVLKEEQVTYPGTSELLSRVRCMLFPKPTGI